MRQNEEKGYQKRTKKKKSQWGKNQKKMETIGREGEEEYRKRKHCKRNIENKEIKLRGKRHKVL